MRLIGDKADMNEVLTYAETAFRRAKQANIPIIVLGSGQSRTIPEGGSYKEATKEFVQLLKKMGDIAAKYDVIVAIEHLNRSETNFYTTLAEGIKIVKRVKHPNIKIICDIYHMMKEDEGPDVIRKAKDYISHVHVAEKTRLFPGANNEQLSPYYKALQDINYKGGISFECKWYNLEENLPIAVKTLKSQW